MKCNNGIERLEKKLMKNCLEASLGINLMDMSWMMVCVFLAFGY